VWTDACTRLSSPSHTGVIICSPTLRNYFINYARPLIYSTAMSHLSVLAMQCSVLYMRDGHAEQVSSLVSPSSCRVVSSTASTRSSSIHANAPTSKTLSYTIRTSSSSNNQYGSSRLKYTSIPKSHYTCAHKTSASPLQVSNIERVLSETYSTSYVSPACSLH
jgi:hypothetical protein